MLRLSTMLLPTGEFAVVLSGYEFLPSEALLDSFAAFGWRIGAVATLTLPFEATVEDSIVDEQARRHDPLDGYEDLGYVDSDTHDQHVIPPSAFADTRERVTDFFGVDRVVEEFVDEEGFTPDDRDYEGPPLTYDNIVRGFDMDAKARTSASGAVADLDAYVGTLDGTATAATGQLVASTEGWDSGDKLIAADRVTDKVIASGLGPIQDETGRALDKLQGGVVLPEVVWEAHRDGQLIAQAPVDYRVHLSQACPCYPALDGGQGEEARRQDEACVAEFGRCEDCPTLQP